MAISDDELAREALAADPDLAVDENGPSLWDLSGGATDPLLPAWYMPAPTVGRKQVRGWRKRVVLSVVVTFCLLDVSGFCATYGQVILG